MRSWLMDFFGPSITVRAYSITGFTLVLTFRVSVCGAFCLPKVVQNPPVLLRFGMIGGQSPAPAQSPRGQTRPNQSTEGQTNPPPPNRCKPRQSPPTNGANQPQQTPGPTRPDQPGPINPAKPTGANPSTNNRPIAGG